MAINKKRAKRATLAQKAAKARKANRVWEKASGVHALKVAAKLRAKLR